MTRERTLTRLRLARAIVPGGGGWVSAQWERSDGSSGIAYVQMEAAAAERWSIARLLIHAPTARKLQDVPLQRITNAINADAAIQEWIKQGTEPETVELMEHDAARRPRLKRPKSRRELDDGFYRRVADAYRGAVANGLPPAKTLAADSETPPGTVNRWIARARNAGYLAEAEPGRVTT